MKRARTTANGPMYSCPECSFSALTETEVGDHYALEHRCVCSQCAKNTTNAHWLELHIDEAHNPFFPGGLFRCFSEQCPSTFQNKEDRAEHCRIAHGWSAQFIEWAESQTGKTEIN